MPTNRLLSWMSLIVLSIIMLYSMNIYIFWGKAYVLYLLIALFCFIRLPFLSRKIERKNLIICYSCFLMYSVLDLLHLSGFSDIIRYFIRHLLLVGLVILLTKSEKIKLISVFTNIYVVIVIFSLITYLFYTLGIDLPHTNVRYEANTSYPDFNCYIFLLVKNQPEIITRFQSVFLEPGHLGMISALLLYVNGYKLKRWNGIVLLLSIFVSLSLAAYLLLLIGSILHYILNSERILKRTLISLIYLSLIVVIGISYYIYDPNAAFSKRVVERLDYDEDKGFSGNNRTNASFDSYYEIFYKSSDCILGIGQEKYSMKYGGKVGGGNSSYKTFIVQYGIVGTLLLFSFFSLYTYLYNSKLLIGLLLLYAASFWQRPYALWEVELFLFIGYAVYMKDTQECLLESQKKVHQ